MLHAAGYRLALHGTQAAGRLTELAETLSGSGPDVMMTTGDLAEPGRALQCVEEITARFGPLDSLVHLAGPYVRKRVSHHSREEFDRMLTGNTTTFFEAATHTLPYARKSDCGRIIGIGMAGAASTIPMLEHGPHLAAKAALVALARTLALEEAEHHVTVNVINPGHIPAKAIPRDEARQRPANPVEHPMGVHGSYEDIGDAILYLLSPNASYITGAVLDISGGWQRPE